MKNVHQISHLEPDVDQNNEDRKGEVDQEPDLHRLDVWGGGEAGWHWEVDRGQDHHAGSDKIWNTSEIKDKNLSITCSHVDHVDDVVLVGGCDVAGGLVDHVHQDSWQVGHQEDANKLPESQIFITWLLYV